MKRFAWSFVILWLACACCCATLLVAAVPAGAGTPPSSTPDQQPWVTNGAVSAVAAGAGGITYIGGGFTYIGPNTGGGAALDAGSGAPDMSFPLVEGTLSAAVGDGAGGYYIGGDFTKVGGIARNDIAHILPDGSVDPAFDPNANDSVLTLAVSGTTVYAGGLFTSIGGQTRSNIAALNGASGLATAWNPNADKEVDALLVSGSTVYAGGWFTSIGGQTRHAIAALNAGNGLATTWAPEAGNAPYGNANVSALAISGSTIYAGGWFTSIGGQARSGIAALNAGNGLATAWNPNAGGGTSIGSPVLTLAVSGSTVYASGFFASIGGQNRSFVAALNASSGLATAWNPGADGTVRAFAVSGSTVYVGGAFTSIGGKTRNGIAALDASSGAATTWNPNPDNGYGNGVTVNALAVSGSIVYAGGQFKSIGGVDRNGIAALDANGAATAWNPDAIWGGSNGSVHALALSGSTLYVGGDFDLIGGQARSNIAALDVGTGLATAWNPSAGATTFYATVYALAVSGSTVYAAGDFTSIGGQSRNRIAALDAGTGLATAWDPNPNSGSGGSVRTLALSGSTVYAGGWFTSIGGQTRNNIAALDTGAGLATAWDPNPDRAVDAISVSGSNVYVAGYFTSIGGQNRSEIAALDAATGLATAWDPSAGGASYHEVLTLAVSGSTVYVGGTFETVGGQARANLAALDAATGLATAWDPGVGDPSYVAVNSLAVSGSSVWVGGSFTTIGGQYRPYWARFSPPTPPTVTGPNGGEQWTIDSTHDITWNPGNGGKVSIELSRDNGSSWATLFASTANDGSESWTVTGPTTSQALVRIANDKGGGSSTATFTIAPALTGSMSLDGDAMYATSTAVAIDSSVSGVTEMRFQNGGGNWSSWEAYSVSKSWTLPTGDGAKTVAAQYRDADGNVLGLSDSITLDTTPPVTTTDAPQDWRNASVTVHLSPTDAGSLVASTEFSTDGGVSWASGTSVTITADPIAHLTDGTTTITYRSADNAGNVEATKTCAVKLDTRKPTLKTPWPASARRGRTATLKCRVNDLLPNGGTATVTIKVKNKAGKVIKTLRPVVKPVNTACVRTFTVPRTWKVATYRFYVYATDAAGNVQAKAASNKLIVK